jgi:hypothetical protein
VTSRLGTGKWLTLSYSVGVGNNETGRLLNHKANKKEKDNKRDNQREEDNKPAIWKERKTHLRGRKTNQSKR